MRRPNIERLGLKASGLDENNGSFVQGLVYTQIRVPCFVRGFPADPRSRPQRAEGLGVYDNESAPRLDKRRREELGTQTETNHQTITQSCNLRR